MWTLRGSKYRSYHADVYVGGERCVLVFSYGCAPFCYKRT